MKTQKISILLFFVSILIDFFTTFYLIHLGFIEHNIIFYVIGEYGFWIIYWSVSFFILLLMIKMKRIFILNIFSIPHLICGINNLLLVL